MPDILLPEGPEQATTYSNTLQPYIDAALTTPHRLFIIAGDLDLTENISVPSYKVNLVDKYDEWTDNNKVDHHDIHSRKIEGTFDLVFHAPEEYFALMAALKVHKNSRGAYDCSVYCNNDMAVYTVEMFIETEPADIVPFLGQYKEYEKLTVNVKQRTNLYIPSS